MLPSERRQRYRRILEGTACVHPASVFDAMSARMAESLGFEIDARHSEVHLTIFPRRGPTAAS